MTLPKKALFYTFKITESASFDEEKIFKLQMLFTNQFTVSQLGELALENIPKTTECIA